MEATLGKINEVVSEAAGHLQSLWTEIGFNEDVCQHRQHKMVEHVKVGFGRNVTKLSTKAMSRYNICSQFYLPT